MNTKISLIILYFLLAIVYFAVYYRALLNATGFESGLSKRWKFATTFAEALIWPVSIVLNVITRAIMHIVAAKRKSKVTITAKDSEASIDSFRVTVSPTEGGNSDRVWRHIQILPALSDDECRDIPFEIDNDWE